MVKNSDSYKYKRLLLYLHGRWASLFWSMICMIIVAASTSATAFLVKPMLDDIFFDKNIQMLKLVPIAVLFVYFLRGVAAYFQTILINYVGESVIMRFRNDLYSSIQDLSLSFFYKEKTGVLMARVTNDVNIVKTMVSDGVTNMLKDFFTVIGLLFVIFYRDWQLALYAIIVLPVAFYPIILIGRRVRSVSTGCQEAIADLNSFLHETFSGNKIVKAFGREDYEKNRFSEKNYWLYKLQMKAIAAKAISSPIMEFIGGIGIAFIIWFAGTRVIDGISTPGTFFSFLTAVLMLYDPVKQLSKLNNVIQEGFSAADRVFNIIDRKTDIIESKNPKQLIQGPHFVSFKDVSFKYEKDMVLKNINLNVKAGEVIALAGMSGGGKTSLVNLIYRFYDISSGIVSIDNIDIRDLGVASLRSQISIVTQEPILFNATIKENIAYGNLKASDNEIMQAAKAAFAYDFVQKFSDGFNTNIGELGSRLSGGEKQRICIARALIKNAPILILDEATSALDAEAEMIVQKALSNLMKGRTTFIIAHRLSTIAHADRIIVMVRGEIVEEGTHDELYALNGEYNKLCNLQYNQKI